MNTVIGIMVIVGALLVVASGVWVAIALVNTIRKTGPDDAGGSCGPGSSAETRE